MSQVTTDVRGVLSGWVTMGPPLRSDTKTDACPQAVPVNEISQTPEPSPQVVERNHLANSGEVRPNEAADQSVWGMTRGDRRVVFVMMCVLFLLLMVHWIRIVGWRPSPLIVERPQGEAYRFVVDVNTATWVEWMQLDGIGETMARRIVSHREEHGPFQSIEQVDHVRGMGPKTFAKICDQLECQPSARDR